MHRRVELQDLLGNIVLRAQAEGEDPAARIDLSKCELCILAKVVFGGPLEVQDLREGLSLPPSTLTGVIGGLEDKKLVRREANPKDRRRVVVHATDAASFALQQTSVGFAGVASAMLDRLSEGDKEDLLRLLRRASLPAPGT